MITSREYWNRRSVIYDSKIGHIYHDAYERTIHMSRRYLNKTDYVLDLGCGTGIITVEIAPLVDRIRAIDVSEDMMSICRKKLESRGVKNVTLEQMSIFDSTLEDESFDVVCAYNILNYLNDRDDALERMYSILKPGGYFLSVTDCLGERLTRESMLKWYSKKRGEAPTILFDTMKGLRSVIADAGFKILESENVYSMPPNLFVAAKKPE